MKAKAALSIWLPVCLLAIAVSPVAAAEGESVLLPGWVAWIMVLLALGVPAALFFILRDRGQL